MIPPKDWQQIIESYLHLVIYSSFLTGLIEYQKMIEACVCFLLKNTNLFGRQKEILCPR